MNSFIKDRVMAALRLRYRVANEERRSGRIVPGI
jgi:hypothetical protein